MHAHARVHTHTHTHTHGTELIKFLKVEEMGFEFESGLMKVAIVIAFLM